MHSRLLPCPHSPLSKSYRDPDSIPKCLSNLPLPSNSNNFVQAFLILQVNPRNNLLNGLCTHTFPTPAHPSAHHHIWLSICFNTLKDSPWPTTGGLTVVALSDAHLFHTNPHLLNWAKALLVPRPQQALSCLHTSTTPGAVASTWSTPAHLPMST